MTQVAPVSFPGRIGSGWPASFHASVASGERTIPIPPFGAVVGLCAVGEEECVVDFQVSVVVGPCFLGE
jgi:hypothetical protein